MDKNIRGAGGGSAKGGEAEEAHTPVEAPDTLHSTAYVRIVDLISEGELESLSLKDCYLDGTPIQNEDDTYNFKNVSVVMRLGTQDQEPLPGFPEVESETGVGVALEYDTPWTHTFTNLDITSIRITLAVEALMETDPETGDTNGYTVDYEIDLKVDDGPFQTYFDGAFEGKTSSQFQRSHVITLPEATTSWTVRVRRLTEQSTSQFIQDITSVVSFTEMIAANLRMPNSAVVGLMVDASQFRSIPTRAYRPWGKIIRVPSNYDPLTRIYTGAWDGTFQMAWTNNPAWIYYDMATHLRYGLGRYITDAQIDKWSLYQIGTYCDELVDDGMGGSEPRFACDIYLQKAADAYKVMQDLASVFRGISYWAAGMIIANCDQPSDPVYSFTNANVIDGRFSYEGSSRQARHTVALVEWSDPNDFGRGKTQYVPNEEAIARYGVQILNMTAIGATSQGQANRAGMWALLSEWLETNMVSFKVGLDGTIPAPGKIVKISDSLKNTTRKGGRIRSATASVITPDLMPIVAPGDDLTCILPSGLAQTRVVSSTVAGTISVGIPYDSAPVPGSVWVIESVAEQAVLHKIIGVTEEQGGLQYSVLAMLHVPEKFDAADFGYTIQAPVSPPGSVPLNYIRPPASVTVSSYVVMATPARAVLVVEWAAVEGAVSYGVSIRKNKGDWTDPVRVFGTRYELENVYSGVYEARVKASSATGLTSLPTTSGETIIDFPEYKILTDYDTGEILADADTGEILYGE